MINVGGAPVRVERDSKVCQILEIVVHTKKPRTIGTAVGRSGTDESTDSLMCSPFVVCIDSIAHREERFVGCCQLIEILNLPGVYNGIVPNDEAPRLLLPQFFSQSLHQMLEGANHVFWNLQRKTSRGGVYE